MNLKTKIVAVLIAPAYVAFAITVFVGLMLVRLLITILNFLGILSAIDLWLFLTRKLLIIIDFRNSLSKEDRKVMYSKE